MSAIVGFPQGADPFFMAGAEFAYALPYVSLGATVGYLCKQQRHWGHALFGGGEIGVEGRTETGFMWRAQAGFWGLLSHGDGTCKAEDPSLTCSAAKLQPGVVQTQEVAVGWAF